MPARIIVYLTLGRLGGQLGLLIPLYYTSCNSSTHRQCLHHALTQFSLITSVRYVCMLYCVCLFWYTLRLVLHWAMQCPSVCWCSWHSVIGWLIYKMHVVRQLTTNNINVIKRVQVYSMQISQCLYELTLRPIANTHSYICYIHTWVCIYIYAHSRQLSPASMYAPTSRTPGYLCCIWSSNPYWRPNERSAFSGIRPEWHSSFHPHTHLTKHVCESQIPAATENEVRLETTTISNFLLLLHLFL